MFAYRDSEIHLPELPVTGPKSIVPYTSTEAGTGAGKLPFNLPPPGLLPWRVIAAGQEETLPFAGAVGAAGEDVLWAGNTGKKQRAQQKRRATEQHAYV